MKKTIIIFVDEENILPTDMKLMTKQMIKESQNTTLKM